MLVRDRLGKKPLLYARLPDGTLAFASETKALLQLPDLPRELDLAQLDAYLALQYVPRSGLARGREGAARRRYAVAENGARCASSATGRRRAAGGSATRASGSSACATR